MCGAGAHDGVLVLWPLVCSFLLRGLHLQETEAQMEVEVPSLLGFSSTLC